MADDAITRAVGLYKVWDLPCISLVDIYWSEVSPSKEGECSYGIGLDSKLKSILFMKWVKELNCRSAMIYAFLLNEYNISLEKIFIVIV